MRESAWAFALALFSAAPCLAAPAHAKAGKHAAQVPAVPVFVDIPTGTVLSAELVDPVSSGKNKAGDEFRARLQEGVWSQGRVVLPPGATLRGVVAEAVPSGRIKGQSRLHLTLASVEMDGKLYAVHSDTLTYIGEPHAGKHFGSWLGGMLQGALYGVLLGGGKDGAIYGAGAGAAAGTAASVLKGKLDVDFPQGTKLLFETSAPISVPLPPAPPPAPSPTPTPSPSPAPATEKPAEKPSEKPAEKPTAKPTS